MLPPFNKRPNWLKSRGYLHITPKINIIERYAEIMAKVQSFDFVSKHAFFPLIHSVIKERKYKKSQENPKNRAHSFKKGDTVIKTAKLRPLHYATHIDALIFGYYAEKILIEYEAELSKSPGLAECITAYRKIKIEGLEQAVEDSEKTGKSTIHFANEAFTEIQNRTINSSCIALMFDIKSFFSELDHDTLKKAWSSLFNVSRLNAADFNVFKATTDFRYILRDDLRMFPVRNGKRSGFDEKKLAEIRRTKGVEAFFESVEDFRNAIKNKLITVYKHPFVKGHKVVGIPQGLPISAVLANLYLLEFDKEVLESIVKGYNAYYRRYSDDILIVCNPEDANQIEKFIIERIKKSYVKISEEKTEKYLFKHVQVSSKKKKLMSIFLGKDRCTIGKPLTYLGFEFYGEKTLIKSANLAKFYRRLIYSVKRKAARAIRLATITSIERPIIFRGNLKRKYTYLKLNADKQFTKRKKLIRNESGTYVMHSEKVIRKHSTNYLSYINRASGIMNQPSIKKQIIKHKAIFNQAISKHLKTRTFL